LQPEKDHMTRIFTLLIAAVVLVNTSFAQDAAAKKVLDAVSAKVKAAKGITAGFTITSTTSKGKSNGTKTGNISIKGQKYFLKQAKMEIISDGKTVWNYDGAKTITVSDASENTNTLSPQNLLSNFYDKDFTYKLISSAGSTYEIEMYPTDKRKNFEKVTVYVNKAKNLITKAKITDKAKNVIQFTLTNVKTDATIAESTFTFNRSKYPKDAEVIE
jgi:outer membrane lipoprotein carrier protein